MRSFLKKPYHYVSFIDVTTFPNVPVNKLRLWDILPNSALVSEKTCRQLKTLSLNGKMLQESEYNSACPQI